MTSERRDLILTVFHNHKIPDWYMEAPSFCKAVLLISSIHNDSCYKESFLMVLNRFLYNFITNKNHEKLVKEVEYQRIKKALEEKGTTVDDFILNHA